MDLLNPLSRYIADRFYLKKIFRAECLTSDEVGDFVYIRADKNPTNGLYRVGKTDPVNILKMPSVGIIKEKLDVSLCVVQTGGIVDGAGLTPQGAGFIGLDAKLTQDPTTLIAPAGGACYVQPVGSALAVDIFSLDISFTLLKRVASDVVGSSEVRLLKIGTDGSAEELLTGDTVTIGGLTLGGDLNMGGNQITNVAPGVNPTDGVNLSQLTGAVVFDVDRILIDDNTGNVVSDDVLGNVLVNT